jgi:hypothetical protein
LVTSICTWKVENYEEIDDVKHKMKEVEGGAQFVLGHKRVLQHK